MLLDEMLQSPTDYAHIIAMVNSDYETLYCDADSFIIHSKTSDAFSVEIRPNLPADIIVSKSAPLNIEMLITTNSSIFNLLNNNYKDKYMCYQYTFPAKYDFDDNIKLLEEKDLPYVQNTYRHSAYILQLYERKRILGYYVQNRLVGYIAHHIDGTVGALYVDPQYRNQHFGSAILKAAVNYFSDKNLYSHVVSTNETSIKLHESIGAQKSDVSIYWMHNKGFHFHQ